MTEYRKGERLRVTVEGVYQRMAEQPWVGSTMLLEAEDGHEFWFSPDVLNRATIERIADPRLAVVLGEFKASGWPVNKFHDKVAQRVLDALDEHAEAQDAMKPEGREEGLW